jgi:hypothetical protein
MALESEITEQAERTIRMYRDLTAAMVAVGHLGVDIEKQRSYMVDQCGRGRADEGAPDRARTRARGRRGTRPPPPDDLAARTELDAIEAGGVAPSAPSRPRLMSRAVEARRHRPKVLSSSDGQAHRGDLRARGDLRLVAHWRKQVADDVATHGAHWLFQPSSPL